ncbi:acyl carrier protein, partial [Nocardiopsis dassonvillei]
HVVGGRPRWPGVVEGSDLDLPTYPFQHQHYWIDTNLSFEGSSNVPDHSPKLVQGGRDIDAEPLRERLAKLSGLERAQELLELVRVQTSAVLGYGSEETVQEDRSFREHGFDSLTGVELRNRLKSLTGLALPATMVFDYPNPSVLAEHIEKEMGFEALDSRSVVQAIEILEMAFAGDSLPRDEFEQARSRLLFVLEDRSNVPLPEADDDEIDIETATDEQLFEILNREDL